MSPETNRYKKIITAIIFLLTVGIITVGILINTNKAAHDFFFTEFFVPVNQGIFSCISILIFKELPVSGTAIGFTRISLFESFSLSLLLIFIIGGGYFRRKKQYELTNIENESAINQKKRTKNFKNIFIGLSVISFACLIYFISNFISKAGNHKGELGILTSLMVFILSLILAFVWN
ncbi:MAG: hypothetical protein V1891_02845 [bacterium]